MTNILPKPATHHRPRQAAPLAVFAKSLIIAQNQARQKGRKGRQPTLPTRLRDEQNNKKTGRHPPVCDTPAEPTPQITAAPAAAAADACVHDSPSKLSPFTGAPGMSRQYTYGGKPAEVKSAAGAKGVIIRGFDGSLAFRVYHDAGSQHFTDYAIRHDDLKVTIAEDELAAFYRIGDDNILDHSPQVLGLERTGTENEYDRK